MVEILFAADQLTAMKVATYLKTWRITLFFNQDKRMYYVHVTSVLEMARVTSALATYKLLEDDRV